MAVTAGRRSVVFGLAALAGVTCGTTGPPPPPLRLLPIQQHTLPSGLRVVLERDEASAVAAVVLTVDVGSVDDPPGKHGMAHTLEHLAFRAPDETGRSMHARLVRLGAASFNGETDIERTTYWALAPRQALDELLAVVLGRLADPLKGMDDKLFAKEAGVVAEELRKREGAAGMEALMPVLLPPGHPHARAHAERRETPPLSLAELRSFAERFYRPECMTLVISSPTPIDLQQQLAGKLPPAWQGRLAEPRAAVRRPTAPFDAPAAAAPDLPTRKTVAVFAPELWMAWRVPPAVGIAAGRLEVVARVVHRMLSGRLDPDGTNDVLDIDAWAVPGHLASAVVCRFKLRSPSDAPRIRDETRGAIEALADVTLVHSSPRLRASYGSAVTEAILRTALGMDSIKERARRQAELAHGEANAQIGQLIDALAKITVDDVADFADRYLKPDAARAVLLLPEEIHNVTHGRSRLSNEPRAPPDVADAEAEPEPEPQPDAAPGAPTPDPDLEAIVQVPGTRGALVRRLSSGLSVIAVRRPGLPFVSMLLGFRADPQPGDPPGARIAFDLTLSAHSSAAPLAHGVLGATRRYGDSVHELLSTFSGGLDKALDLLSDEGDALHLLWPNPAFNRWVDREAMRALTPADQAARAFRGALFGDHAYRLQPTAEAARTLTEREAQAWFARVRRPANGVLVLVGDIAPESAVQTAERILRGWKGDAAPSPPPPPALSPRSGAAGDGGGAQILYTNDPRRQSSYLRFGCAAPPVRTQRDRIVNLLLAGLMKANIYTRLRLGKGVSYGYDVDAESFRGGTAIISGHVDVEGKATADAIAVLRDWFDDARTSPITTKRFEQQRWNRARRSSLMYATGQELARALFHAWNMGWEPAVLDDYARDLASVTQKDVEAALDTCRKSAVISVLGPGPSPSGTGP